MSRRWVCYWPGQTDEGRDCQVPSDDVLNTAFIAPSPPRRSPTPSRCSPAPSCYCTSRGSPTPSSCSCVYNRPWRYTPPAKSGFSKIQHEKDAFKVTLDVKHFKDGDLKVKVVGNQVVVEAQHDEREDEFGYISRSLKRKYALPEDVDIENVQSELSSDGILTITAPKKVKALEEGKERLIPIMKTSKSALTSKKKEDQDKKSCKSGCSGIQDDDNNDDDGDDDV